MILGAEIGMLIMGIIAMVTGKLTLTKARIVYGLPARLLAIISFLPLPLAFSLAFGFGIYIGMQNPGMNAADFQRRYQGVFIGIEVGSLIFCIALLYGIAWPFSEAPRTAKTVEDRHDDDFEGDEPRRLRDADDGPPPPLPSSRSATAPFEPAVAPLPVPPTTLACTSCGTNLKIPPTAAGKQVRCPKCQTILTAPPLSSDAITSRRAPPPD